MRIYKHSLLALLLSWIGAAAYAQAPLDAAAAESVAPLSFEQAVAGLADRSFSKKAEAVTALEASGDERVLTTLRALADGTLMQRKADAQIVIAVEQSGDIDVREVLSGATSRQPDKSGLSKIPINNALRSQLRSAVARLSLASADASVRLDAVRDLMRDLTADSVELLRQALPRESQDAVREAIEMAIAMVDVGTGQAAQRLAAVETLAHSLRPEARQRLAQLLERDAAGNYLESSAELRAVATEALRDIEGRVQRYAMVETVFFGLSLGSVLLLAAIGLAITFGVMGVINMAHGELMMLGAYTTYVVQLLMPNHIDASLFVAIPAAFLVAGVTGIAIERGVIRFLYGRPLETLLATFGISLILQQLVRTVFSPLNRSVEAPSWMSGSLEINPALSLTLNRVYIIVFALLVFFALLAVLKKSTFGLQLRAVAQNRTMAQAMGVRTRWVDALTFGLGSGIAGVAGVALSQLTNVGPNLGQSYIIDSFMVVVFGGVGNLWGMLVGAFSLGVINKILEPWTGAVLAKIVVLVFIILFIQKRPRGLFPQQGRAAEA
jgi:urea transport system permease protein